MSGARRAGAAASVELLAPETAHRAAIAALRLAPPTGAAPRRSALAVEAFGLELPQSARHGGGLRQERRGSRRAARLGFGFVEVGTLTPRPQAGNPRPRLFRLTEDGAVINRLGFNNDGYEAARARLARRRPAGIVGVNIGANKDAADRVADYVAGVEDLRRRRRLFHDQHLLAQHAGPARPAAARRARRTGRARDRGARRCARRAGRVLVKIAPDLDLAASSTTSSQSRARAASTA